MAEDVVVHLADLPCPIAKEHEPLVAYDDSVNGLALRHAVAAFNTTTKRITSWPTCPWCVRHVLVDIGRRMGVETLQDVVVAAVAQLEAEAARR